MHILIESDAPRARKPSKRAQQIDPLLTITPAKSPAKAKGSVVPSTPFAAQQIQGAQNRRAAALLFMPHAVLHPSLGPARLRPLSPSPVPVPDHSTSPLAPGDSSDSDSLEDEVRDGIKKINLVATACFGSGSKSPCTGPHSKQRVTSLKPRGGAKDVWSFFEKSDKHHNCILCK